MSNPGDRGIDKIVNMYWRNRTNGDTALFSPYANERAILPLVKVPTPAPSSPLAPQAYPSPASYRHAAMMPPPCLDKGTPRGFRGLGYLGVTLARRTSQTGWQRLAWAWLTGRVTLLWARQFCEWVQEHLVIDPAHPWNRRRVKPIPWRWLARRAIEPVGLVVLILLNVALSVAYWSSR